MNEMPRKRMTTLHEALAQGYSRVAEPCRRCRMTGFVDGDPMNVCPECGGGGWRGHYREPYKPTEPTP